MPDRDAKVKLGVELDQSTANQIKQFVDDVEQRFQSLDRLMQSVGRSSNQAGQELIDGLQQSRQAADDTQKSVDGLGDSITKVSKLDIGLSGLRRTGGALNQLGLGEIGRPIQLAGDVGQVGKEIGEVTDALGALGISATAAAVVILPVVAAVAALAIGLKLAGDAAADAKRGLDAALDTQKAYYQAEATLTTNQARQRLEILQRQAAAEQRAVEESQRAIDSAVKQFNLGGLTKQEQEAIPGVVGEQFRKMYGELESGQKALDDTNSSIGRFTGGLQSNAFAANDAAEAEQKLAEARNQADIQQKIEDEKGLAAARQAETQAADKVIKKLDEQKAFELQLEDLKRNGLQKDLDAELRKRDEEIKANERQITDLELLKDTTGEYAKKIKELKARNDELIDQQQQIIDLAGQAVDLNEQDAANKRKAAIQQKYDDQVTQAEEQALQRRADIQQKYNGALISAAEKAVEAAASALRQLEQSREDLATSLGRDLTKEQVDEASKALTIQINEHRQEVQELQTHLRNLQSIREQARFREFNDLLNRNFLGVLQSRLQETFDLNKENTSYGDRTAQLKTDEQHQLDDLHRSIQEQRQARLVAYQNALQDADKQYRRALQQADQQRALELRRAEEARDHDLRNLEIKLNNEARIKYNAYVAELKLAAAFGEDRVKLEGKIQQALVDQANATLTRAAAASNPDVTGIAHRASGGSTFPGQAYIVNDAYRGQRESVGGMQFMGGEGVYIPFKSGYVNPGAASGTSKMITNTFNITSHDPQGVRAEVLTIMERVLK